MRDEDENMVQAHPTPSNILRGEMTNSYHLNTFEELECVRCTRPHFYGQPLEIVRCKFCFNVLFFNCQLLFRLL
jgi:hypothetical protein